MSDLELCFLSANELVSRFKARTLSPVDVLKAQIAQAEAVEPEINAFCDRYYDEALAQARVAQERYGAKGDAPRPLEGLSCVIKDEIKLAGKRTTGGSLIFKDNIDTETGVIAERLIEAGAIVHARTTTPEFCLLGTTHSRLWGVTRNPHNPDFTPGGSSGGTGAALAAGTTTLGTGTDIGGSIRIPAGCCGIVGLKASYGRIPEQTPFNLDFYSHCGPMTRWVADCALMFDVVAGPSTRDIASLRDTVNLPKARDDIAGMRVAHSLDLGYFELDANVRRNTLGVLDAFADLGCEVEEIDFRWSGRHDRAVQHYLNVLWGQHMKRLIGAHRDKMTDYAVRFTEDAEKSTLEDFLWSLEVAAETYQAIAERMERFDVFVCPTNAVPAVAADHDSYDPAFEINGRRVDGEYGWVMTHPFNMLSRCPVLSVPSGLADNNVPTGVQIVGKTYDEPSVFRAALALEHVMGFQPPQGYV